MRQYCITSTKTSLKCNISNKRERASLILINFAFNGRRRLLEDYGRCFLLKTIIILKDSGEPKRCTQVFEKQLCSNYKLALVFLLERNFDLECCKHMCRRAKRQLSIGKNYKIIAFSPFFADPTTKTQTNPF